MKKSKVILGITAFNHDSSACLIYQGRVIAFCEEERFNGIKHTSDFPIKSILFCLEKAGLSLNDVTDVAFYFNIKKCLWSYIKNNNPLYYIIHPSLFRRKRFYYEIIWLFSFINKINSIKKLLNNYKVKITFVDHHMAHAWYGYFSSNFKNCTVISNDSIGESLSSLVVKIQREDKKIIFDKVFSQTDPHSMGYLYGAITEFLGFKRGQDEGKVMAMAALGKDKYVKYFDDLIRCLPNGEFRISKELISLRNFQPKSQRLSNDFLKKFGDHRQPQESFTQKHYDIAYAIQWVTEKILYHQFKHINDDNVVITGGIAQNSVANGKLSNSFYERNIFIPPIPNDAGCAIGAALSLYYKYYEDSPGFTDTAFLGPEFSDHEIIKTLENNKINFKIIKNPTEFIVNELLKSKIIAIYRNEMECGPRALGNRSIIANPIDPATKDYINEKIKHREFFQPYGGFIIDRNVKEVFYYKNKNISGLYMSFVYPVKDKWLKMFPSLVHFDKTARIQIIKKENLFLYNLLEQFYKKTGVPIIINTSLNLRGQPMARSPQDALNTFYNSGIDHILFNNSILVSK